MAGHPLCGPAEGCRLSSGSRKGARGRQQEQEAKEEGRTPRVKTNSDYISAFGTHPSKPQKPVLKMPVSSPCVCVCWGARDGSQGHSYH